MTYCLDLSATDVRALLALIRTGMGRYVGNEQLQDEGCAVLDRVSQGELDSLTKQLSILVDQLEIFDA